MSDIQKKSLIDFTDDELLEAYGSSIKNTQWTPANYRKEMFWRSQERNTTAYIVGQPSSLLPRSFFF